MMTCRVERAARWPGEGIEHHFVFLGRAVVRCARSPPGSRKAAAAVEPLPAGSPGRQIDVCCKWAGAELSFRPPLSESPDSLASERAPVTGLNATVHDTVLGPALIAVDAERSPRASIRVGAGDAAAVAVVGVYRGPADPSEVVDGGVAGDGADPLGAPASSTVRRVRPHDVVELNEVDRSPAGEEGIAVDERVVEPEEAASR